MDFVEIDFDAIRRHIYLISPDQPIEEYKMYMNQFLNHLKKNSKIKIINSAYI